MIVYRNFESPFVPYEGLPMIDTRGGPGSVWTYPIGDYLGAFAITDTGKAFYLEGSRNWAQVQSGFFSQDDSVVFDQNYYWVFFEGIGPTKDGTDTLVYAKINGIEYGTSLSIKHKSGAPNIPRELLLRVYPNPIHDKAVIEIESFQLQTIELNIFNILGQKVSVLHHGNLPNRHHTVIWNGRDGDGKKLNRGVYFLVLRSQRIVKTLKILYL